MKIRLNGSPVTTDCHRLHELHDQAAPASTLTIVNGYATTEDRPLQEDDEIFFIDKHSLPPQEALESMMCARHTPHVHDKVKKASVAVAGLGGLGSNAAIYLARTGVGTLHLIDFDTVDVSNLNRQSYRICDLGKYKADALEEQIRDINPFITIRKDILRVTESNIATLFAEDDVICEAFDNPDAKAMLIDSVAQVYPDKYLVTASGMAGYGDSNDIQTRRLTSHIYLCGDQTWDARPGRGLMAPRVAICAAHESNIIIKILVDIL